MGRLSDAMRRAGETGQPAGADEGVAADAAEVAVETSAEDFPTEVLRELTPDDAPDEWAQDLPSEGAAAAGVARSDAAVAVARDLTQGRDTTGVDLSDETAAGLADDTADDLAFDPMPRDRPDRRRSAPADGVPEPARPVPADPDSSLFSRVDLRYARKVVVDESMMPASREQYRRLAAALHHAQEATGVKVVMIASAVAGEGKTLTASNLALTLSESYQRHVLLIDGDLRKPSLHTMFRVSGSPGLTDGLADGATKLSLRQISPRLTLLTAGPPSTDPMAGLTSARMRQIVAEARQSFDWVVVDTSPIGLLTDASLLSAMVDGAILVVKAGSTPLELVRRAMDALGADKIVGVVLNHADVADQPYGSTYQYGYPSYGSGAASTGIGQR